ncbi:MAG: hypothetical protein LBH03_06035 [Holophagales bacterium]|jgi:predicted HicB family RNase H-like nuclease|nr:hypothetical protein [Holophagales bacterium]
MDTKNAIEYRGFTATMGWDEESQCYSGEVMDTWGIVGFNGFTFEKARQAFKEMMDWYLEECEKKGRDPHMSQEQQCKCT